MAGDEVLDLAGPYRAPVSVVLRAVGPCQHVFEPLFLQYIYPQGDLGQFVKVAP